MVKTFSKLQLVGVIALGLSFFSFSCSSSTLANTSCQSNLDCPSGQACSTAGTCETLLGGGGNGNGTGSDNGTSSGGQGNGGSTGSVSGNGSSGGVHAGNSTTGSVNDSNGGSSSSSTGSVVGGSSGGSGATCGCSSACCSEQASASSTSKTGGITCPDGSYCYGSYYCSLAAGGSCTSTDPCNGASGTYTSCSTAGSTAGGSSSGSTGGSPGGGSSSGGSSTGAAPTGTVGPQGGSVSSLVFAIVGDTRPQDEGDTAAYPTALITQIFANITAASPQPQFVIATGDYAYCSGSDCAAQTANYIPAANQFPNQKFLAMGNHECNGYTSSNCASDAYADGVTGPTPNFTNFMSMLSGFGIDSTTQPTLATGNPYYEVDINSSDSTNPWTAKFVFIAANAWDSGQSSWLTTTMAKTTTYTFVIRHESYQDDGAASSDLPGDQGASDAIIQKYPYTLLLVGHTHEYSQSTSGSKQVELIVGNGGAETSGPAGYVICSQIVGGNISCQPYSSSTTPSNNGSAVVVNATGALQ
jgi:hypothetical protein